MLRVCLGVNIVVCKHVLERLFPDISVYPLFTVSIYTTLPEWRYRSEVIRYLRMRYGAPILGVFVGEESVKAHAEHLWMLFSEADKRVIQKIWPRRGTGPSSFDFLGIKVNRNRIIEKLLIDVKTTTKRRGTFSMGRKQKRLVLRALREGFSVYVLKVFVGISIPSLHKWLRVV